MRLKAGPLSKFLADAEAIRGARNAIQDEHNSIAPPVGEEDYKIPVKEAAPGENSKDSRAYGSAAGTALGAGFSMEQVPGMYQGRPDRFFDDPNDPRNANKVEDSHITRNRLAPDLLDMDFVGGAASEGGTGAAETMPVDNLQQSLQEQQMAQQLKEQQAQLEMLRAQVSRDQSIRTHPRPHDPATPRPRDHLFTTNHNSRERWRPNRWPPLWPRRDGLSLSGS